MTDVIIAQEGLDGSPEFSWRAVFAGAVVAVAVTFFLLFLGSGLGLSLISAPEADANTAKNALTLGAIYFFTVQAFGLAVGGYLAGRLMGPVLETESEELFHSTTHGLVVWAVAVVATATMVTLSSLVVTSSAINAAALFGASERQTQYTENMVPNSSGYWVDTLFRPVGQANSADTRADVDSRAQASRILIAGLARADQLSQADHAELVRLVSQSTGATTAEAAGRVDALQARIRQQKLDAAETARRVARSLSLWMAASLCFGALVAAGAAVSGRWVDDKARAIR